MGTHGLITPLINLNFITCDQNLWPATLEDGQKKGAKTTPLLALGFATIERGVINCSEGKRSKFRLKSQSSLKTMQN